MFESIFSDSSIWELVIRALKTAAALVLLLVGIFTGNL
jgi:hypothetical protein